jgi:hypothetical protein
MTLDKHSEHAPFSPPPPQPSPLARSTQTTLTMDEATRNKLLKSYKTQVASASSTVFATLAVTPLENVKTRMQTHNFQNVASVFATCGVLKARVVTWLALCHLLQALRRLG